MRNRYTTLIPLACGCIPLLIAGCSTKPLGLDGVRTEFVFTTSMERISSQSSESVKGYVINNKFDDATYENLHASGTPAYTRRTITLSSYLHEQAGTEQVYFLEKTFNYSASDGYWHSDPKVYWPVGGTVDLIGYSSSRPIEGVLYNDPNIAQGMRIPLTPEDTQNDILYTTQYGTTGTGGETGLTFKHAQAWIQVNVSLTNTSDTSALIIDNISIPNSFRNGTLSVTHYYNTTDVTWDFTQARQETFALDDVAGTYGKPFGGKPHHYDMLIPPQMLTGLVINYHYREYPELTFDHVFEFYDERWLAGRKYVFDIEWDLVPILMGATVHDWTGGGGFVVNVPADPEPEQIIVPIG